MRRASFLLPALAAAVLAATPPARSEPTVSPWKPAGDFEPAVGVASRLRSHLRRVLFRAQFAGVRGLASPRQPLHRGRLVETRPAFVRLGCDRGRSLVHARRRDPLFHLHACVRRQEGQGPRHLARRARRGRLLGRAREIAGTGELERNGMVPAPRAGWIALLRIKAARRSRRQRYLACAPRRRWPLVCGESRSGDQHRVR